MATSPNPTTRPAPDHHNKFPEELAQDLRFLADDLRRWPGNTVVCATSADLLAHAADRLEDYGRLQDAIADGQLVELEP